MKVTIIGTGKVAKSLGNAFKSCGIQISGVWGRSTNKAKDLSIEFACSQIINLDELPSDAIAIVCVSDSAIAEVLSRLPSDVPVAYTSGSIMLSDLPPRNELGVFYPLQTFSKDSVTDLSVVPFLIESKNKVFESTLFQLATKLSSAVLLASSELRYHIHIAAVMVNNFSNFLFHLAEKHLLQQNLSFDLLKPLLQETILKLEKLSPKEAQTGPAVRGDRIVVEKHISSIKDADTKILYELFSNFIQKEFLKK